MYKKLRLDYSQLLLGNFDSKTETTRTNKGDKAKKDDKFISKEDKELSEKRKPDIERKINPKENKVSKKRKHEEDCNEDYERARIKITKSRRVQEE